MEKNEMLNVLLKANGMTEQDMKKAEDEKTACERVKECEDALCELAEMLMEVADNG